MNDKKLERRAKEWLIKDKGGSIIQSLINLINEFVEPRDKRIEELEESLRKLQKSTFYMINEKNKYIHNLEKENAELKKRDEQLTKAKEILADIIKFQPYINRETMFFSIGNDWKKVIYKVEQFLNSEVEK